MPCVRVHIISGHFKAVLHEGTWLGHCILTLLAAEKQAGRQSRLYTYDMQAPTTIIKPIYLGFRVITIIIVFSKHMGSALKHPCHIKFVCTQTGVLASLMTIMFVHSGWLVKAWAQVG